MNNHIFKYYRGTRNYKRVSTEERKLIIEDANHGLTHKSIAAKFGVARSTVSKILSKNVNLRENLNQSKLQDSYHDQDSLSPSIKQEINEQSFIRTEPERNELSILDPNINNVNFNESLNTMTENFTILDTPLCTGPDLTMKMEYNSYIHNCNLYSNQSHPLNQTLYNSINSEDRFTNMSSFVSNAGTSISLSMLDSRFIPSSNYTVDTSLPESYFNNNNLELNSSTINQLGIFDPISYPMISNNLLLNNNLTFSLMPTCMSLVQPTYNPSFNIELTSQNFCTEASLPQNDLYFNNHINSNNFS